MFSERSVISCVGFILFAAYEMMLAAAQHHI
jgi:hypothetical protein